MEEEKFSQNNILSGQNSMQAMPEMGMVNEPVQLLSIPVSQLGEIISPKPKRWPIVVAVVVILIGVFLLYDYNLYLSLLEQQSQNQMVK